MGDVSVTKLYRQTERHDEVYSRFSQFCEKRLKFFTVTSRLNLKCSRGEYVEYGISECDAV